MAILKPGKDRALASLVEIVAASEESASLGFISIVVSQQAEV